MRPNRGSPRYGPMLRPNRPSSYSPTSLVERCGAGKEEANRVLRGDGLGRAMARCGQEEMVKQRPWSVTDAKGATGSGTWGASSGELGEGGGKGRGRGARDGGRRILAAMARRLLRRLASMATGKASSSKRSLARCRQGRGRRQRRKGATTMMGPCAGWLSWWSPTAAGGDGIGREALLLSLSATAQRGRRGSSAGSPWQCGARVWRRAEEEREEMRCVGAG